MFNDSLVFPEHEFIAKHIVERRETYRLKPQKLYPWWLFPCKVRILLVTDGGLDFGAGDFGMSTFVQMLVNDGRSYVKFEVTIAHRGGFVGDPGVSVKRSIPNFSFSNSSHFTTSKYDQVWLFGINSGGGLTTTEKNNLSAFMNAGGGVFATGDHGSLGNGLCGDVARVRKMRYWNNSSGEVGMSDPQRNDTNRVGHDAGSQFDDQSDDVPQVINPKMYSSYLGGFYKEVYPHPILCGSKGVLKFLPDHPHEGECIVPNNLSGNYHDGTPEFPGGIAPEIIATSTVPAGNTAGVKQATNAHSFGAICAYDGHKADIGRVVTESTWHHYTNVNLIGEIFDFEGNRGTTEHWTKLNGFMSTVAGQQALAKIKEYFINLAVWLSPASKIKCMNSRIIWVVLNQHRVLEATMDHPRLDVRKLSDAVLFEIGSHARDVLGKIATRCRTRKLIFDIFKPILPEFVFQIDPWTDKQPDRERVLPPMVDFRPLEAMALGAGLLAVRDELMNEDGNEGIDERLADAIIPLMQRGAAHGLERGLAVMREQTDRFANLSLKGYKPRSVKAILKEAKAGKRKSSKKDKKRN